MAVGLGRVPYSDRPARERDCADCGAPGGMQLQNVARPKPANIPLLYVCTTCGARLTIPPPARRLPPS